MNKNLFYIVDAGSTKTDLAIVEGDIVTIKSYSGFNPNHSGFKVLSEINDIINKKYPVYFYGSGLSSSKNQILVKQKITANHINVYSDVLGTARALLKQKKGIIAILGTGGVAAYYDGKSIQQTKGGYGYLIDDVGGGVELAKSVVSKWLNNELSEQTSKKISEYFNSNPNTFIHDFYKKNNQQKYLAGLCEILIPLAKNDNNLTESIVNYFDLFIEKHILKLTKQYQMTTINFSGSIAYNYKNYLNKSLSHFQLVSGEIISKPIYNLIDFHKTKNNNLF